MRTKYPARVSRDYVAIEREAREMRRVLGFDLSGTMSGLRLFERLGHYAVQVKGVDIPVVYSIGNLEPGALAEARFDPDFGQLIVELTPESYEHLERDWVRARFSLFHEIGHLAMHPDELLELSRIPRERFALQRAEFQDLKPWQEVEWQANAFAGALSIPAIGLERLRLEGRLTVPEVMADFRMSKPCSRIRIQTFNRRRNDLLKVYE